MIASGQRAAGLGSSGFEQVVCNGCGAAMPPQAYGDLIRRCCCGSTSYRLRAVLLLEEDELEYVIELVQLAARRCLIHERVLERLLAEQRYDLAPGVVGGRRARAQQPAPRLSEVGRR